jgi:hypothetical protein
MLSVDQVSAANRGRTLIRRTNSAFLSRRFCVQRLLSPFLFASSFALSLLQRCGRTLLQRCGRNAAAFGMICFLALATTWSCDPSIGSDGPVQILDGSAESAKESSPSEPTTSDSSEPTTSDSSDSTTRTHHRDHLRTFRRRHHRCSFPRRIRTDRVLHRILHRTLSRTRDRAF